MKAYKGFDKDLKCRGFQYEVGKEYEEGSAKLCKKGFHACENPLDTLRHYGPTDSRYCEVDVDDNGERNDADSKVCGKYIKIGAEIGLKGVINAGVRFVFDKCESATGENASGESGNAAASGWRGNAAVSGWRGNAAASGEGGNAAASGDGGNAAVSGKSGNAAASGWRGNAAVSGKSGNAAASGEGGNAAASGWRGNAAASGESGNAAASGWRGNAAASGERGTAAVTGCHGKASAIGKQCIAVAWGQDSFARGSVGNWLVVSERDDDGNIIDAKIVRVDGEAVKENTWYTLQNGEISEVEE
nr:MAG TPA: hypothetical protein [Caudoviricetes sp.]